MDTPPGRGTSGLRQRDPKPPEAWEPESWVDEGPLRGEAEKAVSRSTAKVSKTVKRRSARDLALEDELQRRLGNRSAGRVQERIVTATNSFEHERYSEVRKLLAPLVVEHPDVAIIRELLGLSYYRLGDWRKAVAELEAYRLLNASVEHLPVLADCYRAMRRFHEVSELWNELREASPSAALMAEGRIVYAGSLADQGELRAAIRELKSADVVPRRVKEHHLRLWYVSGDLYDRSGDTTRARQFFGRVQEHSPGYADVEDRLAALGR